MDERIRVNLPKKEPAWLHEEPVAGSWWQTLPIRRRVLACGILAACLVLLCPPSTVYPYSAKNGLDQRNGWRGPYPWLLESQTNAVWVDWPRTGLCLVVIAGLSGATLLLLPTKKAG